MIDFSYTAKDKKSGETLKGKISADSKNAAAAILIEKSLYPIKIVPADQAESILSKNVFGSGIKPKERVIFTRQLATLTKAGLPITQALSTSIAQVPSKNFRSILEKIAASVQGGQSLAKSFGEYPDIFNRIYVSLVAAGEESGTLDESLERLALQQEKQQQVLSKVRGALIYPAIVFVVIIGVLIFMITTVLPQVANLYKELGQSLPFLTQALLGVSNILINFWYLAVLLLVLAFVGIRLYIRTPNGRKVFDGLKIRVPLIGVLFKKVYAARFARTLSSLVNSGVPLLRALKISGEAVDNVVIQKIIDNAADKVKVGESLSSALTGHPELIQLIPQMIKVGEESGTLGDMLDRVATFFEDEVDQAVKNISGIIEPIMIVFLGLCVLVIVIAVLFPIYGLVSNVNSNNVGSGGGGANVPTQ